jgi:hypothetical protein
LDTVTTCYIVSLAGPTIGTVRTRRQEAVMGKRKAGSKSAGKSPRKAQVKDLPAGQPHNARGGRVLRALSEMRQEGAAKRTGL